MNFLWHEKAKEEADAAAAFYFEKQPTLAQRFIDQLEEALHRILRHPLNYRTMKDGIRKCKIEHFPYCIVYRLRSDYIEIVAVMHLRRLPGYWQNRVS